MSRWYFCPKKLPRRWEDWLRNSHPLADSRELLNTTASIALAVPPAQFVTEDSLDEKKKKRKQ